MQLVVLVEGVAVDGDRDGLGGLAGCEGHGSRCGVKSPGCDGGVVDGRPGCGHGLAGWRGQRDGDLEHLGAGVAFGDRRRPGTIVGGGRRR